MGGYKEIIAEISGRGAFAKLKFESGVHRVQRVPDTEGSGPHPHLGRDRRGAARGRGGRRRRSTSATSRSTRMRAGGAGGQHVNKTESAIRITHIPTGIVVMMQEERSQHRNRAKAMAVLRARLYDHERAEARRRARRRARAARSARGDRSERIRTYNFPQGRVSDHRINLTLYKLPQVIEGEALGEIIDALVHRASGRAAGGGGTRDDRRAGRAERFRRGCAPRSWRAEFRRAGIETPELDARILVGHALGLDQPGLRRRPQPRARAQRDAMRIAALAARRLAREPVARIVGAKEFWGLPFSAQRRRRWCRGPRPKPWSRRRSPRSTGERPQSRALRIADLGTGSGALLLALLSELPNALRHRHRYQLGRARHAPATTPARSACRGRASLRRLRLRRGARAAGSISSSSTRPMWRAATSRRLRPRCAISIRRRALDGGADGLDGYRAIAADARRLLAPSGMLVVEIGAAAMAARPRSFAAAGLAPGAASTIFRASPGP